MEFFTDHLLELTLTDPKSMKASTDVQHDNFARQLSSFEKLLVISHSRLSVADLYKNLKLVLKAGNKGMLKITSIDSLIECIELYKATNSDEESEVVSEFFDSFLTEVTHLARVNKFFHNTIYRCLYQFFYEPSDDNSDEEFQQEDTSDEEDDDNRSDEGRQSPQQRNVTDETQTESSSQLQPNNFKININQPVKRKKKKKKRKAKQNLLNNVKNKRKRVDNRMKVLEQIQREKAERQSRLPDNHKLEERQSGKEFEKLRNKTDRQKLAFAAKRVFNIKLCWDELITTGSIPANCFEDDSLRQVRDYKNFLPFEAVFRLLPDILVKGFKLIELSKIWYNCARRLGGAGPSKHRTIQDFFTQVDMCDQSIETMRKDIQRKKEHRVMKQTERKMLVNQILRFDEVREKYEQCVEKEWELKEYYKQLKGERNAEYPKLDSLERDDPDYKKTYDQIQYLADAMKGVYRELQTASYELELVKQDYTVGMDNRTNLIRRQNDVKSSLKDIDTSLPADRDSLRRSCHLCDKIRSNVARMWVALYKAVANQLLTEQADILLQCKYSTFAPINNLSNAVASDSPKHCSSSDEAEQLEETLDNVLSTEMEKTDSLKREDSEQSELGKMKATPPPPLPPATEKKEKVAKEKSVMLTDYRPSTAGILDRHEARQYRERVERLKKKFELDLTGLQTKVDCDVDAPVIETVPVQKGVASGDEADMESDQEEMQSARPQSKKLVKRNPDRYSPLSDASDDYIYQQQIKHAVKSPRTIYVLKKSVPKEPTQNRYILKTVTGATLLPQKTLYQQQKPTDKSNRPKPHERQWANDYNTLQALDNNYVNTLSVYKNSHKKENSNGYHLTPALPLEHHEGVFTANVNISDGDISIDSGTGDSLDSDDGDHKRKSKSFLKSPNGYKHKPRMTVREKLAAATISNNSSNNKQAADKHSKLPRLQKKKVEASKNKFLSVESPTLSKSSPESLESRPIVFKQSLNKPAARNTLHMRKKVQPPAAQRQQPKQSNEVHPLAPTKRVAVGKLVERKLPMGKVPKSIQQPKIVPRKQHAQVLESPSDDETDEIFKQSTISRRTLPPKPSLRVGIQPTRVARKYGIQHSLTRAKQFK